MSAEDCCVRRCNARPNSASRWICPRGRKYLTDAIRYWEHKRVVYNLVLVIVVLVYFGAGFPASKRSPTLATGLLLILLVVILLAVLANVAIALAYGADVFAQMSRFRKRWRAHRAILLVTGLVFAGTITDSGRRRFSRPRVAS